jgi:hypothetical protein
MRIRRTLAFAIVLVGLSVAGTAKAQFVALSQCHSAYPCSIPFGLQYHPDPLIAAQYGQPSHTPLSARIELKFPLRLEVDRPLDQKALDEAMRKGIEVARPGPSAPEDAAPAIEKTPPAETDRAKPTPQER